MIKNLILLIGIAALTYVLTLYFGQQDIVPRVPVENGIAKDLNAGTVPDFEFGTNHNMSDFKGKIVILNFWASWCTPCIKEFPMLIQAAQDDPDNVVLIALSSDMSNEAMQNFFTKMPGIDAPNIIVALDENQAITNGIFQTFKLPETIIIARDQTMRHKFIGANWTYEDLKTQIDALR